MKFIPLFYGHELLIVNPEAPIAIVTLWSLKEAVFNKLKIAGIDMSIETSKIAVIGNLRAHGISDIIRNLQYNPQINTLLIIGNAAKTHTRKNLISYFNSDFEDVLEKSSYFLDKVNIKEYRIKGSNVSIDELVHPERIQHLPVLIDLGENILSKRDDEFGNIIKPIIDKVVFQYYEIERNLIRQPNVLVDTFPSNPKDFSILKPDIYSAWEDLVYIILKFGVVEKLKKGERKELQNLKVVIETPSPVYDKKFDQYYWLNENDVLDYQDQFYCSDIPSDVSYTYGNRLKSHFDFNTIDEVVIKLKNDIKSCS